jgi:hypothetical protein
MSTLRVLCVVALTAPVLAQPCAAAGDGDPSGLDLIERCHALNLMAGEDPSAVNEETLRNYGYCLGYMVGFVSGFAARDAAGIGGRFCPPSNAKIADFVEAMRRWLVDHPDGLNGPGALVTLKALQSAFDCPDSEKKGEER